MPKVLGIPLGIYGDNWWIFLIATLPFEILRFVFTIADGDRSISHAQGIKFYRSNDGLSSLYQFIVYCASSRRLCYGCLVIPDLYRLSPCSRHR